MPRLYVGERRREAGRPSGARSAEVGVGLAAAGVGAALGAGRRAAGRAGRPSPRRTAPAPATPYGSLRGRAADGPADDGTELHVEVDDAHAAERRRPDGALRTRGAADRRLQPRVRLNLGLLALPAARPCAAATGWCFWDQRGHGRSAIGPGGELHDRPARPGPARVIDAVAPEGPLVLVGHSMGGMTIMALADQRPELFRDRVVGVAFVCTSAGGLAEVPWRLTGC